MTSRDFCYWLQGMFEVHGVTALTKEQTKVIHNHLHLVFVHEIDTPDPTGELQAAHDGKLIPSKSLGGSGIKRC
jgi:hypothetical protein